MKLLVYEAGGSKATENVEAFSRNRKRSTFPPTSPPKKHFSIVFQELDKIFAKKTLLHILYIAKNVGPKLMFYLIPAERNIFGENL